MAGNEIAQAWVTLIPSFQGGQKAIAKELGAAGDAGGKEASKGFVSGIGGGVLKAGKIAAGGVALVGGAIAGIAATGGFNRAMQIEQAEAKLSGLGHEAKNVEGIMADATAAVTGTAFGLGDAATVAASVVAAGVEPGKELQRTLGLVGDAATIAGTDLGSMGSIISKVASSDMMQMDVANQLMDAGIPILQLVGEEMGVTAEEARKMASEGKVSFETFQNAIETGMGGAALKSGETFMGSMANVKAALGRVGETILTPFLAAMTGAAGGVIPAIDSINTALKPMMENVGAWLTGELPGIVSGIGDAFGQIGPIFSNIWAAAQPFLSGLGQAFAPLIPQVMELSSAFSPLSLIFKAIQPLLPQIAALFGSFATYLADALAVMVPLATTLAGSLVPVLTNLIAAVLPVVGQVLGLIAGVLPQLVPLFAMLATAVVGIVAAVAPLIVQLVGALLPVFMQLISAVLPVVVQALEAIIPAVLMVVDVLMAVLMPIIQALLPVVTMVFQTIATVIEGVMQVISGIIQVVMGVISGNWGAVWQGILTLLQGVWNIIKSVVMGAITIVAGIISSVMGVISGVWNGMWTAISTWLSNTWDSITSAVDSGIKGILDWFSALPGDIMGFLSGLPGRMLEMGGQIMQGLIDGIKNIGANIAGVIGDIVGGAIDFGKSLLGINSPSRVFMEIGEFTGEGLALGIESQQKAVQRATDRLMPGSPSSGLGYDPAPIVASGRTLPGSTTAEPRGLADAIRGALDGMEVVMDGRRTVGALATVRRT